MSEFGKVAVLMGGNSSEREISLKSGAMVLNGLLQRGIDATPFDPAEETLMQLQNFDRAFIVLHGQGGEDGVIQGALEALGIPYTGSGVLGSALAMDKLRSKQLWKGVGLPTPMWAELNDSSNFEKTRAQLGFPLMVKPVCEGSSIGMYRVETVGELQEAYRQAAQFAGEIIAERWIDGEEYTVSILGDQALPVIRLETPHDFYDFEAKYSANTTQYHCPCSLDWAAEQQIQEFSKKAFDALGCTGWGRVDLMMDNEGKPWLLEVNTVPGMTDHSLVPMAAKQQGIPFDQLVEQILAETLR